MKKELLIIIFVATMFLVGCDLRADLVVDNPDNIVATNTEFVVTGSVNVESSANQGQVEMGICLPKNMTVDTSFEPSWYGSLGSSSPHTNITPDCPAGVNLSNYHYIYKRYLDGGATSPDIISGNFTINSGSNIGVFPVRYKAKPDNDNGFMFYVEGNITVTEAASGGEAIVPNITDNSGGSLNITFDNGTQVNGSIAEDVNITVKDSTGKKLIEVEAQFTSGDVDLSNLVIEYDEQRIVVDFSSVSTNIGATHTLFYPNGGIGFILCPEAKSLSEAVPGCLNETLFTHYEATNNITKSVAGVYNVTATIDGNDYKVSGLIGTAITWAQNVSIITRVSVSNTPPTVDTVTLSDSDGGDMDLYPNASVVINCSGTASDTDGWSTISINATINTTVAAGSSDNLLNHYSNISCLTSQNTATQANYYCTFSVWYNAIPGTWTCIVTADDASTTASNTDEETMGQLMAIDINQGDLDFGALAVGGSTTDSSLDHSKNKTIYNQGNVVFDINLKAYGDSGIGDNHSMSCDVGNITISMLRYTFNTTAEAHNWTLMSPILNGSGTDYNISIPVSPDISGTPANPSNDTWWAYKIPTAPIVSGDCSGTLIFSAISDN